jgi:hypothetical protein
MFFSAFALKILLFKKKKKKHDMVVHACISSYLGDRGQRICVRGKPEQKVNENLSLKAKWAWWFMPAIPVSRKVELGGSQSMSDQIKAGDPN